MVIFEIKKIGKVENIENLKKLLLVLMTKLDSPKYKTELIKLCFILDYKYCQTFHRDKGPTTVEYIKYNYGPYADCFKDAFEELKKEGLIIEVILPFGEGLDVINKKEIALEPELISLLEEVLQKYGKCSLKKMKEYIYTLEEFKKTKFGDSIVLFSSGISE